MPVVVGEWFVECSLGFDSIPLGGLIENSEESSLDLAPLLIGWLPWAITACRRGFVCRCRSAHSVVVVVPYVIMAPFVVVTSYVVVSGRYFGHRFARPIRHYLKLYRER